MCLEARVFLSVITREGTSGFANLSDIQSNAVSDAHAMCGMANAKAKIIETTHNDGPYILGKYPRAEVTFECN